MVWNEAQKRLNEIKYPDQQITVKRSLIIVNLIPEELATVETFRLLFTREIFI